MIVAIAFVVAAAAGALARAEAGRRWNRHDGYALGTLGVNVLGSFALGLLHDTGAPAITIVGIGGLGAFTTFSSFARDAVALAEVRDLAGTIAYVAATCILGIGAAAAGIALA